MAYNSPDTSGKSVKEYEPGCEKMGEETIVEIDLSIREIEKR